LLNSFNVAYGAASLKQLGELVDADKAAIDYSDGEEEDEQEIPLLSSRKPPLLSSRKPPLLSSREPSLLWLL
jgi:hypothetical protein